MVGERTWRAARPWVNPDRLLTRCVSPEWQTVREAHHRQTVCVNTSKPEAIAAPAWPWRLAGSFVIAVLVGHVLVAIVGLSDGRSLFDRGLDADSIFGGHWLADLNAMTVNSIAVGTAAVAVSAVTAMQRGLGGRWRPVITGCGWLFAGLFTLILPGNLSMYVVPLLLPLGLFRAGWPEFSIILLAAAGLVLGLMTLRYHRVTGPGCPSCGRAIQSSRSPQQNVIRAAKLAAYLAALSPMGYVFVRLSWAAGIPVGTTTPFLRMINEANPGYGTIVMEVALAGMAIGGALLCWGLSRPWSRTWPRWIPFLRGHTVPRWFPVGMGIIGGAGLFGYASTLVPDVLRFLSGEPTKFPGTDIPMTALSYLPSISLIVWAPSVIVASILFSYATRGDCVHCRAA